MLKEKTLCLKPFIVLILATQLLGACAFVNRDVILKTPFDADTSRTAYVVTDHTEKQGYYNIIKAEDELAIADLQDITILVRKEHTRNDLKDDMYATFKVNAAGDINLPLIGKVQVAGLNRDQAAQLIEAKYSEKELKRPLIDVRINNLYVVVMGEVAKQGKYIINREDYELIDLLGEAGGLTPIANKHLVKIIRGDRSRPEVILVDLANYAFLKDPRLKLRSRDIIYVEPRTAALKAHNAQAYSTFFQIGFVALNTILLIVNLSK
jgi:polysaccharide export outer membrane protein